MMRPHKCWQWYRHGWCLICGHKEPGKHGTLARRAGFLHAEPGVCSPFI